MPSDARTRASTPAAVVPTTQRVSERVPAPRHPAREQVVVGPNDPTTTPIETGEPIVEPPAREAGGVRAGYTPRPSLFGRAGGNPSGAQAGGGNRNALAPPARQTTRTAPAPTAQGGSARNTQAATVAGLDGKWKVGDPLEVNDRAFWYKA